VEVGGSKPPLPTNVLKFLK